jgi:hypothetical protein
VSCHSELAKNLVARESPVIAEQDHFVQGDNNEFMQLMPTFREAPDQITSPPAWLRMPPTTALPSNDHARSKQAIDAKQRHRANLGVIHHQARLPKSCAMIRLLSALCRCVINSH